MRLWNTQSKSEIDHMARLGLASRAIWSRHLGKGCWGLDDKTVDVFSTSTFPLVSPSAYYACQSAGVPVVQTLHNYRLLCPSAIFFATVVCEDCLGRTVSWPGVRHACYRIRHQTAVVTAMLTVHSWLRTWKEQVACVHSAYGVWPGKFIEESSRENRRQTKLCRPGSRSAEIKAHLSSWPAFTERIENTGGCRGGSSKAFLLSLSGMASR
jgi:hypothetical protein